MELKFRAWNKIDKVMIYDLNSPRMLHGVLTHDSDDILIQFTGLTDKNGQDIYEGDIIKHDKGNHVVKQFHGCWMFERKTDYFINAHWYMKESEVIGNIHMHPELMEQDDE